MSDSNSQTSSTISRAHDMALSMYGSAIGCKRDDLITPALILDVEVVRKNLEFMSECMKKAHSKLRAHIKVHKSPDIARMQIEAGAIGIGTATLWEAIVMARSGMQDVFVINEVIGQERVLAAARLAREVSLKVAVDDPVNVKELSNAAQRAGSVIGCMIEVDTGMQRCGVASPEEALELGHQIIELPGLRLDGITGYEGHCAMEFDKVKREVMQRQAMDYFVGVADLLKKNNLPCHIVSAAGTATWELTANHPGITEIQPGSYATMDNYHARLEPRFKRTTTVLATVISRKSTRLVTDVGAKTVGADLAVLRDYDYPIFRYDEEHGIFTVDASCPLKVGDKVELNIGYTPYAVNFFDVYHVVEDGKVVDIWPIIPRGPGHAGLLNEFKEERSK
jgi:D-serine deaminase-like pyridoxal phosphate-dependent protein